MANVQGGTVVWDLSLEDKNFSAGLSRASSAIQKVAKSTQKSFVSMTKNLSSSFKSAGQSMKAVGSNLTKGVTVPIVGAGVAIGALTAKAGKFQSVSDAFQSVTKSFAVGGSEIVASVKKATSGTISEMDVMTGFLKASSLIGQDALGESGENFERMAVVAKKAARATGQDVNFMFESIVTGVGRASPLILDNLGITLKAGEVYENYAESIGKSAKELTTAEQKQAILNAALSKGEEIYKDVAVSAGGISSSFARLKVQTEEAAISIGMALIPVVQDFLEAVTPIVVDMVPKLVAGITKAVDAFQNLSPGMKKAIAFFIGFLVVIGPIVAVLGSVVTAIGGVIAAFTFLALNPIILVIGAIIAVIALLALAWKKNLGGIQDKTKAFVGVLKSAFEKIKAVIKGFFDLIIGGDFTGEFGRALGLSEDSPIITNILGFRTKLVDAFGKIKDTITGLSDLIVKGDFTGKFGRALGLSEDSPIITSALKFRAKLVDAFQAIKDIPKLIFKGDVTGPILRTLGLSEDSPIVRGALALREAVINAFKAIGESIAAGTFIEDLKNRIIEGLATIAVSFQTFLINMGTFFAELPMAIAEALAFALGTIIGWGVAVFEYLVTNVPLWIEAVVVWFRTLPVRIMEVLTLLFTNIMMWLFNLRAMFIQNIVMMIENIVTWFTTLLPRIFEILTNLFNIIVDWGTATWAWLSENVTMWIKTLVTWFSELPGKIHRALSELAQLLKSRFVEGWAAIKAEVSSWPGRLKEWGKNIANAFVQGIKDGLSALAGVFKDAFNRAKGSIEGQSPPKEGPFKDIDKWGFNVGSAWIEGMAEAIGTLDRMLMGGTPALATTGGRGGGGGGRGVGTQNITINIDKVGDEQDIAALGREFGFRAGIEPQVSKAIRIESEIIK